MATVDQSGSSANLMNSEGIQLVISEVEDEEVDDLAQCQNIRISFSSESSAEAADVEKDNPGSPKEKEPFLEFQVPPLAVQPEIHFYRPGPHMSSQEAPRLSPQIQMMGHSSGYDPVPNRIPSSIFSRSPATPMEWSVASNDSLFSIHMGNGSFSRDHVFMLYKSAELSQLEDTSNVSPSLHTVIEAESMERKSEENQNCSEAIVDVLADDALVEPAMLEIVEPALLESSTKAVLEGIEKNVDQEKTTPVEETRSSISSTQSFQSPVLAAENAESTPVEVEMQKQSSQVSLKQWHQEALPQTPKATPDQETLPETPKATPPQETLPETPKATPPQETLPETLKANPKTSRNSCFGCFSCFSFRPWRGLCRCFC